MADQTFEEMFEKLDKPDKPETPEKVSGRPVSRSSQEYLKQLEEERDK